MKKGMRLLAVASALTILLGGCGTPMYELTDEEEDLIVQGASYMLAKYNIYQKDGMNAARPKQEETEEDKTEESTQTDEGKTPDSSGGGTGTSAGTVSGGEISLADAIGHKDDLKVAYKNYSLMDVYEEGSYFSLSAGKGNTFVVLHFEISNPGKKNIELDEFEAGHAFYLDAGSAKRVPEKQSFIADSLASYVGKVPAGGSVQAVLIFEITKEQAEGLSEPVLTVEKDNTSFSVNL